MNSLKIIGKSFLYIICIILISTLLITLLNYFNLFGTKLTTIFKIIIPVIALFTGGIIMGKNSNKKGWFEGLKLGIIFNIILFIFNYLGLSHHFELKTLIYNVILITSAIFGSIIGINQKKEQKKP